MPQADREQLRRDRLRGYEATLGTARDQLAVLAMFVRAREARSNEALEEQFAAVAPDALPDDRRLPAAVWVALRNDDLDTAVAAVLEVSRDEVVIGTREEMGSGYRLTTVEERRAVPDVPLLITQLAAFVQTPPDVVAMVAGWGADDPRTVGEIDSLLEHRFGAGRPASGPAPRAQLSMSSEEFATLLSLSQDQRRALGTLVRQSSILIDSGDPPRPA